MQCKSENPEYPGLRCVINHDGDLDCTDHYALGFSWSDLKPSDCYSPDLEHNRCQAGHPIHHDTTGRYETDTWVHCLIADVVQCPHDTEQILDVRPGKHRVTS